jgi:DNA-binding CsgD family transcriptional regulator
LDAPFAALLGLDQQTPNDVQLRAVVTPAVWPILEQMLAGVASGVIESCRGRGHLRRPAGGEIEVFAWLGPMDGPRRGEHALLAVVPCEGRARPPEPWPAGFETSRGIQSGATSDERAARLERHLTRIASEVQAAGILELGSWRGAWWSHPALSGLTERQANVLRMVVAGEGVADIGEALFVSPSTVRNHLSTIYRKVGVRSKAELLARLLRDDPSAEATDA